MRKAFDLRRFVPTSLINGHVHFWIPRLNTSKANTEWCLRDDSVDLWNPCYQGKGAMTLLLGFIKLANGVEALYDWIFEYEDIENELNNPVRKDVKEALWMLQRYGQRMANLDFRSSCSGGSDASTSYPPATVTAAKEKLLYVSDSIFWLLHEPKSVQQKHPIQSLAIDIQRVIVENDDSRPTDSSLVSALEDGEAVALSRMHAWSVGLTHDQIVERLSLNLGWRHDDRFDGTIQQEYAHCTCWPGCRSHPEHVKLEDTMREQFGRPTTIAVVG
ncbi:hypothetical protein LTR37_013235 [Vermiconidia calcicola]|uniref:Uncharacterized protein n=1 Tax=Vermiconidia calcicola TaxID=1690605 RepID=A0ACC3MXL9_9PEZI|nr:hypothetical protein LTR37_013235 [Vermiconidia calcicola]